MQIFEFQYLMGLISNNKIKFLLEDILIDQFFKKIQINNCNIEDEVMELNGLTIGNLAKYNAITERRLQDIISLEEEMLQLSKINSNCIELVKRFVKLYPKIKIEHEATQTEQPRKKSTLNENLLLQNLTLLEDQGVNGIFNNRVGIVSIVPQNERWAFTPILDVFKALNWVDRNATLEYHIRGTNITLIDINDETFSTTLKAPHICMLIIHIHADYFPKVNQLNLALEVIKWNRMPVIFSFSYSKNPDSTKRISSYLKFGGIRTEELGGQYQSQNISIVTGDGIPSLIEKIIFESEFYL